MGCRLVEQEHSTAAQFAGPVDNQRRGRRPGGRPVLGDQPSAEGARLFRHRQCHTRQLPARPIRGAAELQFRGLRHRECELGQRLRRRPGGDRHRPSDQSALWRQFPGGQSRQPDHLVELLPGRRHVPVAAARYPAAGAAIARRHRQDHQQRDRMVGRVAEDSSLWRSAARGHLLSGRDRRHGRRARHPEPDLFVFRPAGQPDHDQLPGPAAERQCRYRVWRLARARPRRHRQRHARLLPSSASLPG